jgi:hypothetical protein
MTANPTDERLDPGDLRWAARACAEALAPALDRDWRVRAGDLDWDAYTTLDHVVGALGYYAVNLAMRATVEVPFVTRSLTDELISADPRVPASRLMTALEAMAAVLADVARAAPSQARGYHPDGLADVEGFIAIGCDEILVHADDIARGFGSVMAAAAGAVPAHPDAAVPVGASRGGFLVDATLGEWQSGAGRVPAAGTRLVVAGRSADRVGRHDPQGRDTGDGVGFPATLNRVISQQD